MKIIEIKSRKTEHRKQLGEVLTFAYQVRSESKHVSVNDRRRRVFYVLAAYTDLEGFEYRKSFESYDQNPTVPPRGSHKQLNALAIQY